MAAELKRYRFVKDDDGHNYMIEVGHEFMFRSWVEATQDSFLASTYTGRDFNQDRIPGSTNLYTFTNPKEDE